MIRTDGYIRTVAFRDPDEWDSGQFPFTLAPVRDIESLEFDPSVTFFVGENGSGKSTILEALAVVLELNPEGGSRHLTFEDRPGLSGLHEHIRPVRNPRCPKDAFFLRAESFFNVATELEKLGGPAMRPYGGISPHDQSHGESFLRLVANRFGPNGLYLLDEPEAALSPKGQLSFLKRLNDLVEGGAQFIIATHSPILMAYPEATIYQFSEAGLDPVEFEETEHFELYRNFLDSPERFFRHLFD